MSLRNTEPTGFPHLDEELRGPRLTRGVAGIWDDVQSDLGPRFLERISGRRLWVAVNIGHVR